MGESGIPQPRPLENIMLRRQSTGWQSNTNPFSRAPHEVAGAPFTIIGLRGIVPLMEAPLSKTDDQWRELLSEEQFLIARKKAIGLSVVLSIAAGVTLSVIAFLQTIELENRSFESASMAELRRISQAAALVGE